MFKRCIGIDIGSSYLRAVQLTRKGQQFYIEKVFSTQTRRRTDLLPDMLRSLVTKHKFDQHAEVAVSLPHEAVFFRNLQTSLVSLEQVYQQSASVLEHDFPIQSDKIITQVCSYHHLTNGKFSLLIAAIARKSLQETLNILAQAKMHPHLVDTAIFAIHSIVSINHPEIIVGRALIAYIDESYLTLAILENNDILIVRNIPIISSSPHDADSAQKQVAELLTQEAKVSWQKVFTSKMEQNSKMYLLSGCDSMAELKVIVEESLPCQITTVEPYTMIKTHPDCKTGNTLGVATGLALRVLAPEKTKGINFLQANNADLKPALNVRRELAMCAALIGSIIIISLVGLFMRLSFLETSYTRLKNETAKVFQTTLPEEKKVVSPLVQLEQKMESLRKDYQLFASFCPTHAGPLEVLRRISVSAPAQANLEVDDLLIASEAVRISGTCDSFESVYQWQRQLQEIPGFSRVDVQELQKQSESGAVHFTILLSSALREQK